MTTINMLNNIISGTNIINIVIRIDPLPGVVQDVRGGQHHRVGGASEGLIVCIGANSLNGKLVLILLIARLLC